MGYNTQFSGTLLFPPEMTIREVLRVQRFLGEDCREHPEWGDTELTWIDLSLTGDASGLEWNGGEKSYNMEEKIELIINNMRKDFPDFYLNGILAAQGEEIDDRYKIIVNANGVFKATLLSETEGMITCPERLHKFSNEE